MTSYLDVLCCPACGAHNALRAAEGGDEGALRCDECNVAFPSASGIPVLWPDPDALIQEWRFELAEFARDNATTRDKLLAQLAGQSLPDSARARVERLRQGLAEHAKRITGLAAAAGIEPTPRTSPDRERVPGEGTITAYYHQVHRDWAWDDEGGRENTLALQAVRAVAGNDAWGHTLVLGAGACRLTRDVHVHCGATPVLAFDINPLPFWIARRMLGGVATRLFEFPLSPRTSAEIVVDRELTGMPVPDGGLQLAFADGLDPPVRDGAFDTVFTPWFIDQVPRNLAEVLPTLRRVLKPGGRWVNFGPLIYHPSHTMLAHRYRVDEVLELATAAGFEVGEHRYERLPYMESPAGTQGRTEFVLTSVATRTEATVAIPKPLEAEDPPWLTDPEAAVPQMPGLAGYQPPHPMFAAIVALIDGRRTTREITEIMVQRHSLPEAAAHGGVKACLAEIARALGSPPNG